MADDSARVLRRLEHIVREISIIRRAVDGRSIHLFFKDPVAEHAVLHAVLIISEAVRHVPESWTSLEPAVPWHDIRGIGNRIRHFYDNIDHETLWDICTREINVLEAAVRRLIIRHKVD